MGRLTGAVREGGVWVDARLADLRESLTPGQRWTAALALATVVMVLAFGAPRPRVEVVPPALSAAAPAGVSPEDLGAAGGTGDGGLGGHGASTSMATGSGGPATGSDAEGTAPAGAEPGSALGAGGQAAAAFPLAFEVPLVIALARPGDGLPTGRNDQAMAEAFLEPAAFPARVEELDGSTDLARLCTGLAEAGVVLASEGLPRGLTACLTAAGVTVLAHDSMRPGGGPASGSPNAFSTRRVLRDGLAGLAAWGGERGHLDGAVGIAAASGLRREVKAALPAMRAQGIDPIVHYVTDAASAAEGVRRFADDGVDVTVFAMPVDRQRDWLAIAALLLPDARYIVADAADAVVDGRYPPSFDGALALTPRRFPWSADTPMRERCRERWEDAAGGPALDDEELARAFMWCEHVAVVERALEVADNRALSMARALGRVSMASPLTSRVGPLEEGGWGPQRDFALTWRASCGCWSEPEEATNHAHMKGQSGRAVDSRA